MLGLFDRFSVFKWIFFFSPLLEVRLLDIILSTNKNLSVQLRFISCFFSPLQDRFGQKHVVEILKEELEEGRLASLHCSAHYLEEKEKTY